MGASSNSSWAITRGHDQVSSASPSTAAFSLGITHGPRNDASDQAYKIGQRVRCREDQREDWIKGRVTGTSPLEVKPDGWSKSFSWNHVEPDEEDTRREDLRRDASTTWMTGSARQVASNDMLQTPHSRERSLSPRRPLAPMVQVQVGASRHSDLE